MPLRRCRRGDTAGYARRDTGVDAPPALNVVGGGAPRRRQRPVAGSGTKWARVRPSTTCFCHAHDSCAVYFIPCCKKCVAPAATAVAKNVSSAVDDGLTGETRPRRASPSTSMATALMFTHQL